MSKLETPFVEAIEAKQIESAVILGRDLSGKSYTKYLGTRTLLDGSTIPISPDSILYLASATKLLTSIAALQLVDAGHITLSTDLSTPQFLPELTQHGILGSDPATTTPVTKPMTLTHLLTHSAGTSYRFMDPRIESWQQAHPAPKPAPSVPVRMAHPLAYEPGEGWMYGTGLDWAGCLVERLSGLSLDDYLRERVLTPLGIKEPGKTLSFFPVKEGLGPRMVDLNPRDKNGEGLGVVGGQSAHDGTDSVCYGGHGAYMTGEAYLEVLYSLLKNDGRVLKREMVEEMFRPQLEQKATEVFEQALESPVGVFFKNNTSGKDLDYGLGGLLVQGEDEGGLAKGSLTWGGGHNSAWFVDPKNGTCGFAAPQFGMPPPPMEMALGLKGHFRHGMKRALAEEGCA
ncbi:MAG: hypothetical protein MMC23_001890 [Stictis urceolatum]|nr:hypothetical protein [Stictis urceolata]